MNYWENEQPTIIDTERNVLRYFPQADKLQVCQPSWTDKDGNAKQGKTVTLDLTALRETQEAVELLRQIVL